jgi:hypothetical protein
LKVRSSRASLSTATDPSALYLIGEPPSCTIVPAAVGV